MKFSKHSYKELPSIISIVYILVMFCIYPLYMKEGYVDICDHKYIFFLFASLGAIILLLLGGFPEIIGSITNRVFGKINLAILIFAIISIVSYLISKYRNIALQGTDDWYMGLATMLIICVISYLISVLLIPNMYIFVPIMIVAGFTLFLGITDRFSWYIIPLGIRNPSFISTLGNINWFMGFYSVIVPFGTALFIIELDKYNVKKDKDIRDRLKVYGLLVFLFIAYICGFSQGCESVILLFAALFAGSLFLWHKDIFSFSSILTVLVIWGASGQIVRLLKIVFADRFNYSFEGALGYFVSSNFTFVVGIIALVGLYLYDRYKSDIIDRIIKLVVLVGIILCVLGFVIIGILKTNTNLISGFNSSAFIFNERFGSGRGMAYKAAVMAYGKMPFYNKLFGIGPDSFSSYVYSLSDVASLLKGYWPNNELTNAHCELLTMLVNEGILGLASYVFIFITFIIEAFKRVNNKVLMCISLSVFCYLMHNLISFSQILNTPFIFILMSIGNSYILSESKK